MTTAPDPVTPRVRRWLRRLAIVVFSVALPMALHATWDYIELRRLIAALEAIRQRGEPLTEAEATHYNRDQQQKRSAWHYYVAAAALVDQSQEYPPRERAADAVRAWVTGSGPAPASLTQVAAQLEENVARSAEALALADTAGRMPLRGSPPMGFDRTSGDMSRLLHLQRLMHDRTIAASIHNEPERAVDSVLSAIQIRRPTDGRWLWIETLGIGEMLSLSQPSPRALRQLQTVLEAEDSPGGSAELIMRERARTIERVWSRYYGRDPNTPHVYELPMRSIAETIARPLITNAAVRGLRKTAALIEAARRPWPERLALERQNSATLDAERVYREGNTPGPYQWVFRLFSGQHWQFIASMPERIPLPWYTAAVSSKQVVHDRAARAAIAVELYRRDHGGLPPPSMAALAPTYVSAPPQDPYTGREMVYKADRDAFTIYSVGSNLKDDGGIVPAEVGTPQQRGRSWLGENGEDMGIRVLLRGRTASVPPSANAN